MTETRRSILVNAAGIIGSILGACSLCSRAGAEQRLISCTTAVPSAANLHLLELASSPLLARTSTTGDRTLDLAVRQGVLDCYRFFSLQPAFYYVINDPVYDHNAFASDTSSYEGLAGTVGVGLSFLREVIKEDPSGYSAMYVIAHEFGHIVQFNTRSAGGHRLDGLLRRGRFVKLVELHADFLAGFYLGDRYKRKPDQDLSILLSTIRGDNYVQHPNHHGTTSERLSAFRVGYRQRLLMDRVDGIASTAIAAVGQMHQRFG